MSEKNEDLALVIQRKDAEIERLCLALHAISLRMNYGTMNREMRYAQIVADEAIALTRGEA